MRRARQSAFSLVELAIVLTIVALIIGGVLGGVALQKAAAIRSISTDLQRFQQATHQFYDKYNSIPGDMTNATSYWGTAGGTGSDTACQNAIVTAGTATCNGNGNGTIDTVLEYYRFWQHLGNAGLIPGFYTGAPASPPNATYGWNDVIGTNIPASKLKGTAFAAYSAWAQPYTALRTTNWIFVAACCNSAYGFLDGATLRPEDALAIDTKLDDGYPGFGSIQPKTNFWATCTTTNVATTAQYLISTINPGCNVQFNFGL